MTVVADAGPVISLALTGKPDILETLYGEVYISETVWQEVSRYSDSSDYSSLRYFAGRVKTVSLPVIFSGVMDPGEAEAVSLYHELGADYLIIDDRTARRIAESSGVRCLGTLAVLVKAREMGLISALRPLFVTFLAHKRYYKNQLLNSILADCGEAPL
jgi:predicted nucleic acid-binding protein